MSDANQFFSKRPRALKFEKVGTSHTLHITEDVVMAQQTDFDDPSILLWWDDEKTRPKMQAIVVGYVKKGLTGPDDDGARTLYIKGYMQPAVTAALREAKAKVPGPGGELTVTYSHDGEKKGRGKPPKMFSASYVTPNKAGSENFFGDEGVTEQNDDDTSAAQRGRKAKAAVGASSGADEEPPF